jgi:predicted DNA-binding protein
MQTVNLNRTTYQRIATFAKVTGKTVSSAVDEAINDWMDTHGEPIMKSVERRERQKQERTCRVLMFRAERKA